MKKGTSKPLKVEQLAELTALATLPDDAIDTSDAPAATSMVGRQTRTFLPARKAAINPPRRRRCDRLVQSACHVQRRLSDAN